MNELDFSGKTVLVVGGSSGIGNGIARAFRERGATVHVWGTRRGASDYADSPDSSLAGLHYAQVDVSDAANVERCVLPFASLDVLVQAQGTVLYDRQEFKAPAFRKVLDVNLTSLMACADRCFEALKAEEFPYLVAMDENGQVLGYAYAGAFRARPAYRFVVEDSVYIAPDAQGRGVGRLLMERLIETVRAMGFRQFVAVIGDGHAESASVKLHERLGFSHSGRLVGSGYKHGRWLDTVFMQLALNGGASTPPDPDSVPERRFRAEGVRP